jgi:hypothetical protein
MARSTVELHFSRAILITLLCACVAATLVPLVQAAGAEKSASGELVRVDTNAKTFTIKSDEGEEMEFFYSDQTVVVGGENGIQGLSSNEGSKLTVSYTETEGRLQADRIEIKPGA